jgi:hypothetical protein
MTNARLSGKIETNIKLFRAEKKIYWMEQANPAI